jgi:hypothetical protein
MEEADEKGFKAACPTEWQGMEQERFLREWASLRPSLAGLDLRGVSALSRDTIAMVGRRRGLSAEASAALKVLAAVKRLPSPNADKVAKTIPPLERAEALAVLLSAMRRHTDWSKPPPELNGAQVLSKLDAGLTGRLREFLIDMGGIKPAPWLSSVLRPPAARVG